MHAITLAAFGLATLAALPAQAGPAYVDTVVAYPQFVTDSAVDGDGRLTHTYSGTTCAMTGAADAAGRFTVFIQHGAFKGERIDSAGVVVLGTRDLSDCLVYVDGQLAHTSVGGTLGSGSFSFQAFWHQAIRLCTHLMLEYADGTTNEATYCVDGIRATVH